MRLKSTTLRDFGGGWNALNDDLNMGGTYQPVLDNVYRALDGTLTVRQGYLLFADMRDGTVTTGSTSIDVATTSASRKVTVTWTAHPFSNGDHVTFTDVFTVGGLVSAELCNKPLGVAVVDANTFFFYVRTAATATTSATASHDWIHDTHSLAGNIVDVSNFSSYLIVIDTVGEIVKISDLGVITRIWDTSIANSLSGTPAAWAEMDYASTDIFKGQLLVCNGLDKPLVIDFTVASPVQYLVDLGSGSNLNTPIGRYVKAVGRWVVIAGDPDHPNRIHVSATDTSGTFFNDPLPNDALYLDINYTTNSASFTIRGISKFRDQLIVAFDDAIVPVTLGIFDTSTPPVHKPNITDVVSRFGAVSHKSMIFLGFDLLMADPVGVPSLARSLYNSEIVPARQSMLIGPPIQRNIARLSTDTLRDKVFAIYSIYDFQYQLYMPDFDNDTDTLESDPFFVPDTFTGTNKVIVKKTAHGHETGDVITFSGATDFAGITAATYINKQHTIAGVIDDDYFLIEIDTNSTLAANGGGSGVSITRDKAETTCYAFTYDKTNKSKTWARYHDLDFVAGTVNVYGRIFMATNDRIWRMGTSAEPITTDLYNNYDSIWATSTNYVVGDKVYDNVSKETYTCLVAHTSGIGTFAEDRTTNSDNWEKYLGEDITFAFETPWADYGERTRLKLLQYFSADSRGKGPFTVEAYTDFYYRSKLDGTLTPQLSMDFVGGDSGGFGVGDQPFGSGRIASRQRMYPFPARGKLLKFRVSGSTHEKLKFVALQFAYAMGSIYR